MYTESCINAALTTLAQIESNTGLQISYEKIVIYRVESLKNTDSKCYTVKPIAWSDGDIDMLGITIKNAPHQDAKSYWPILDKIDAVANNWGNRDLSWLGKTLVINTLMTSLYTYQLLVMLPIEEKQVQKYYNIINKYFWKGSKPKIPIRIIENSKKKYKNFAQGSHDSIAMPTMSNFTEKCLRLCLKKRDFKISKMLSLPPPLL